MSLIGINRSDSLLSARFMGLVWKSKIPDPTTGGKKWKPRSPISFDGDYPWMRLKMSALRRVGFVATERKNFGMAPGVMEQVLGYDFKADIWSFGKTALELAHGHAPFSTYPPMKVLLVTLQNAPPALDYERDKKFSKSFKQMIASCLVKDPSERPTAKRLLKHSFFKQARSNDYISRILLEGLPALGDRLQALKVDSILIEVYELTLDEGRRHACTKENSGRPERGNIPGQGGSTMFPLLEIIEATIKFYLTDSDDNTLASVSPVGSTTNMHAYILLHLCFSFELQLTWCNCFTYAPKCERSDDDVSVITTLEQPTTNISLGTDNHADNNLPKKSEPEIYKKSTDGVHTNSGCGLIVDDFRASLTPQNAEALICTQD
ncbi:hypothetical protein OROHE_018798 [Orobanche hederae]